MLLMLSLVICCWMLFIWVFLVVKFIIIMWQERNSDLFAWQIFWEKFKTWKASRT